MKPPLVVIAGPTASGKTAISIEIAKRIQGEIISGDSMQVYKYMDIGTAKIMPQQMQGIKHYLIDELYPEEEFNVAIFQKKAKKYLEQIFENKRIPILCGGTGFYINALVNDNYFMETNSDPSYRNYIYELARKNGTDYIYKILESIDPIAAKAIHPHNEKRVARALEFYHLTGIPISQHNKEEKLKSSPYQTAFIILTMEREILYQRINKRVDEMVENGLFAEVEMLLSKGYSPYLVSMQGIGYKEILPYIKGDISKETAVDNLKIATRHFAKRQLTWFKGQTEGHWIDLTQTTIEDAVSHIMQYLQTFKII